MAEKTILVVEDNEEFQRLLKHILTGAGYRVLVAGDGVEGMERVRADGPDMVLLDIQMPRMNGYEVCKAIRAEAGLGIGRIPIILVSVQSKVHEIVDGLKLGADDYVTKPFDPAEVLARVSALFRQSGKGGPTASS
ncbi:MAG: response regulator transcription factor [Elusimicrobiota bacterium]